ncbi:hypothetical protein TREES_T100021066 [Tupaia chinensis]|uniref:Uncharacterized protein n=1 Tax=Tupaia chinensis TaxID=246437 RepID=L9JAR5_TUPCH|nr:hypothetical protein TREES_T100021066 [Tupaia chinensis]
MCVQKGYIFQTGTNVGLQETSEQGSEETLEEKYLSGRTFGQTRGDSSKSHAMPVTLGSLGHKIEQMSVTLELLLLAHEGLMVGVFIFGTHMPEKSQSCDATVVHFLAFH